MSAKAIREATAKDLINRHLSGETATAKCRFASVDPSTKLNDLVDTHPWLKNEKLVVKPDQLIKRRGKLGRSDFHFIFPFPGQRKLLAIQNFSVDSTNSKNYTDNGEG